MTDTTVLQAQLAGIAARLAEIGAGVEAEAEALAALSEGLAEPAPEPTPEEPEEPAPEPTPPPIYEPRPGTGAWGKGPFSKQPFWRGVRFQSDAQMKAYERLVGAKVDAVMVFLPKGIDTWDDVAGGPGDGKAGPIRGQLDSTKHPANKINNIFSYPNKLAVFAYYPVPRAASNADGANPQVWADIAAGQMNGVYRRLGRRLGRLWAMPEHKRYARTIMTIGHEMTGGWYPWSIRGAHQHWPTAFARIVTAIRAGFKEAAAMDCPLFFECRFARQTAAPGVLWSATTPPNDVCDVLGASVHDGGPMLTAKNWDTRLYPCDADGKVLPKPKWGQARYDGWENLLQTSIRAGQPLFFDEWGAYVENEGAGGMVPSPHPEQINKCLDAFWFRQDVLPRVIGETFFYSSETTPVLNRDPAHTKAFTESYRKAAALGA